MKQTWRSLLANIFHGSTFLHEGADGGILDFGADTSESRGCRTGSNFPAKARG